jgi:hypothetical protein
VAPVDLFFPAYVSTRAVGQIGCTVAFIPIDPTVTGSVSTTALPTSRRFIRESALEKIAEWDDILLGYRKVGGAVKRFSSSRRQGYSQHVLSPRRAESPILTVPRTWKNIPVAAAIQQTFEGKVLTGSCIGQKHRMCRSALGQSRHPVVTPNARCQHRTLVRYGRYDAVNRTVLKKPCLCTGNAPEINMDLKVVRLCRYIFARHRCLSRMYSYIIFSLSTEFDLCIDS